MRTSPVINLAKMVECSSCDAWVHEDEANDGFDNGPFCNRCTCITCLGAKLNLAPPCPIHE